MRASRPLIAAAAALLAVPTSGTVGAARTAGAVRGIVDVVYATVVPAGWDASAMDCTSTASAPADDMAAMMLGFASRSIVPADL